MMFRLPQGLRPWVPLALLLAACSAASTTDEGAPELIPPPPPALPEGPAVQTDLEVTSGVFVLDSDASTAPEGTGFWASTAWWESSSTPGAVGDSYRVAATDSISDPAWYWWNESQPTCRTLSAWWTAGNNRSASATYVLLDAEDRELDRFTVDQTTNGAQWNRLGEVSLPAGTVSVALSRWGSPGGVVVADALEVAPCGGVLPDEPDEPDEPVEPWLSFTSPASGSTVENPVTFTLEGEEISTIRLSADGWEMASWEVERSGWQTTYSFSGTDVPRRVLAEGFDSSGAVAATATLTITPVDPSGGLDEVPYFYQYDNYYEPGGTCGLTSTAMVLDYWTERGLVPDDLYERYGKAQAQSPEGIAQLLSWEGLNTSWSRTGTRSELRAWIDSGRPVIVHGYWTGAGHIAVIIGYDDRNWIVHDPAGDWEVCYGCGGGEGVLYSRTGAWDERLSSDGDIWYSVSDDGSL